MAICERCQELEAWERQFAPRQGAEYVLDDLDLDADAPRDPEIAAAIVMAIGTGPSFEDGLTLTLIDGEDSCGRTLDAGQVMFLALALNRWLRAHRELLGIPRA